MKMAAEQMIQRTIAVGLLIAMCGMVGATGAIASEYEFAPPEALDMAQGLGPQQPFDAPGESQWNLSGVDDTAHGTPIGTCCAKCGGGMCLEMVRPSSSTGTPSTPAIASAVWRDGSWRR